MPTSSPRTSIAQDSEPQPNPIVLAIPDENLPFFEALLNTMVDQVLANITDTPPEGAHEAMVVFTRESLILDDPHGSEQPYTWREVNEKLYNFLEGWEACSKVR